MRSVRTAAKAIIIRDGALLVTVNRDPHGVYYLLPGGGQLPGEPLPETLKRECLEETGVCVEVGELALVRDYVGANHEFAREDDTHQLELMFLCSLPEGEEPVTGTATDDPQTGVAWLPVDRLDGYRLYPAALANALQALLFAPSARATYLGDVN